MSLYYYHKPWWTPYHHSVTLYVYDEIENTTSRKESNVRDIGDDHIRGRNMHQNILIEIDQDVYLKVYTSLLKSSEIVQLGEELNSKWYLYVYYLYAFRKLKLKLKKYDMPKLDMLEMCYRLNFEGWELRYVFHDDNSETYTVVRAQDVKQFKKEDPLQFQYPVVDIYESGKKYRLQGRITEHPFRVFRAIFKLLRDDRAKYMCYVDSRSVVFSKKEIPERPELTKGNTYTLQIFDHRYNVWNSNYNYRLNQILHYLNKPNNNFPKVYVSKFGSFMMNSYNYVRFSEELQGDGISIREGIEKYVNAKEIPPLMDGMDYVRVFDGDTLDVIYEGYTSDLTEMINSNFQYTHLKCRIDENMYCSLRVLGQDEPSSIVEFYTNAVLDSLSNDINISGKVEYIFRFLNYKIFQNLYSEREDIMEKHKSEFFIESCYTGKIAIAEYLFNRIDDITILEEALMGAVNMKYTDIVRMLLSDDRVSPAYNNNYAITIAVQEGTVEMVALLLNYDRIDPNADNGFAIRIAAEYGYTEIVQLLLEDRRADPASNDNIAFIHAASKGYTEIVKLLLEDRRADPTAGNNHPIRIAAEKGYTEIVKLLLGDRRADPTADNNYPIRIAAEKGYTEIVKLLLEDGRADPTVSTLQPLEHEGGEQTPFENHPMRFAAKKGHTEIVNLLLQDPRVEMLDPGITIGSALLLAAKYHHIKTVEMLLRNYRAIPGDSIIKTVIAAKDIEMLRLFYNIPGIDKTQLEGTMKQGGLNYKQRRQVTKGSNQI